MKKVLFAFIIILLCACGNKPELNIIPLPAEVTVNSGTFKISKNTVINYENPELKDAAEYLQKSLNDVIGNQPKITVEQKKQKGILLNVDASLGSADSYKLDVDSKGVHITGSNPRSVMLGIQTLRQLMPLKGNGETSVKIPKLSITDQPQWEWRGMMLDVARHFFDKQEVMRFLDMMAMYKFNKFHWHLTDDQGWRVEIKKYPRLTAEGGWRKMNSHDRACINLSEKESNPDYKLPVAKLRNGISEYGGYYTQEDIREVVAYAAKLGIDVIPEIDMPGHFSAAINSYPELSCFNQSGWGKIFSAPICPGKDGTLEFCKNVYSEIFDLFPYVYVHLGADEVEKDNWIECPDCQARMKEYELADEKELQSWFVHEMEAFFTENGKKMIGWDEILEGGMSQTATMMWWRTWARNAVHRATEQGNEVILTPNATNYFDYKQDHSTLRKLHETDPVPEGISAEQRKLIKGVQANTWAEYIPSFKRVEYMTTPRIMALSEVAWSKDEDRSWDNFYPRLITHFDRLDDLGVNYRPLDLTGVHVTNAFVGETEVTWNYPLPNVQIRYTTDGSIPDKQSKLYTKPFKLKESTNFTIRFFRPDGSAADIVKTAYKKENYRDGQSGEGKTPGLHCEWHEAVVNKCAVIDTIPIAKEYVVDKISIPEGVSGKRAMVYRGYISIDKDDIYTFSLGSDDGSMLYINDEVVVDNDGPHGPVTLNGQMALGKGLHPIRLYYFDMNNGGFIDLKMFDSTGQEIKLEGSVLSH